MLHVFYVNEGHVLSVDVSAAVGAVHQLQQTIQQVTRVPIHDQVLLVSGGEVLDADRLVSSYHGAGTDSNPLYLLCKVTKNSVTPAANCNADVDELKATLNGLIDDERQLSAARSSFKCVQDYVKLSQRFQTESANAVQIGQRLVQEQHMLYQGWLALCSNMDDSLNKFEKRAERFKLQHDRMIVMKKKAVDLLNNFDDVLDTLAKITLPSCLIKETKSRPIFSASPISCDVSDPGNSVTLLEWINATDNDHSLHDVAQQIQLLLAQVSESDVQAIQRDLSAVREQANNKEMSEIKGISTRFAQLDLHFQKIEELDSDQRKLCERCRQQEERALKSARDDEMIRELCQVQKDLMRMIIANQQSLISESSLFARSKAEVLTNVRTRLSGWIVQAYERLHAANGRFTMYEEKYVALKRRLDLIRQIRDAPIVYACAVAEVIRRRALSQDFMSWTSSLVEKSRALAKNETIVRETFSLKLDRHFLRALFTGMSDVLPDFAVEPPQPFDLNLPPIDATHLRSLRAALPILAAHLQVSDPQIYQQLAVNDPRIPPHIITTDPHRGLHRDESFFVPAAPTAVTSMPNPNAWLSGDENLDFSPSMSTGAALLMTKTPSSRSGSTTSMHQVVPLSALSPIGFTESESTPPIGQSAKSAPIRIPNRGNGEITSSRQMSEKSSHFGTPEENFGGSNISSPPELISRSQFNNELGEINRQMGVLSTLASPGSPRRTATTVYGSRNHIFAHHPASPNSRSSTIDVDFERAKNAQLMAQVDSLTTQLRDRDQSMIHFRDECSLLFKQYSTELESLKRIVLNSVSITNAELEASVSLVARSALALESQLQRDVAQAQLAASQLIRDDNEQEMNRFKLEFQKCRAQLYETEKQNGHLDALIVQKDDVITLLEQRIDEMTKECALTCEQIRSETIKQLTIDCELQIDSLQKDQKKQIETKDIEISHLRQQLSDRDTTIKQLRCENDELRTDMYTRLSSSMSPPSTTTMHKSMQLNQVHDQEIHKLRTEMEKEFKTKMQLLQKGMDDRKSDELARMHKEFQIELRMTKEKFNTKIMQLEDELARANERQMVSQSTLVDDEIIHGLMQASMMNESAMVLTTPDDDTNNGACAMVVTTATGTTSDDDDRTETDKQQLHTGGGGGTLLTNSSSRSVQTRIRLKDMRTMISVQDIHEGCVVLVIWNEVHSSYVLFSTSSSLYFVKERSVRQLGLTMTNAPVLVDKLRRCWLLGIVTKLEFCQIRKVENRYQLPLGSRFYRVDLDPIGDSSSSGASLRAVGPV